MSEGVMEHFISGFEALITFCSCDASDAKRSDSCEYRRFDENSPYGAESCLNVSFKVYEYRCLLLSTCCGE